MFAAGALMVFLIEVFGALIFWSIVTLFGPWGVVASVFLMGLLAVFLMFLRNEEG